MYTHPLRGTRRSGRSFADAASTSGFATAVIAPRQRSSSNVFSRRAVGTVSDTGNLDLAIVIRTRVSAGDPIYGPAAAGP
jgi:predicted alpha/beta hydrolase